MRYLVWAAIAAALFCTSGSAQEYWWGYTIPTTPRILVVHGDDLWRGNVQDTSRLPTLRLDGAMDLPYYADERAETNWAVSRVLQFVVPDAVGGGDRQVELTTNDGRKVSGTARLGPTPTIPDNSQSGTVVSINRPMVVTTDQDFRGSTLRPSVGFADRWLIELRAGTIRNLKIEIPESLVRRTPYWGVLVNQDQGKPVGMQNVTINNGGRDGAGLYLLRCFGGSFRDVTATADYALDAQPNGRHGQNVFYRCHGRPREWGGGQMGRALLGDRTLAYDCSWVGLDRGPSAAEAGPPQLRTLLYRCYQEGTGHTVGGSEGIVWESLLGRPTAARVEAERVILTSPPETLDDRAGVFVWKPDTKDVVQIVSASDAVEDGKKVRVLITDPKLPDGQTSVVVGNGCIQCTVANCTAKGGAKWIWLFCRSMGFAVLGGQCDCLDAITYTQIDSDRLNETAFDWGMRRFQLKLLPPNVRDVWKFTLLDWSKPPEMYYPWLRYSR